MLICFRYTVCLSIIKYKVNYYLCRRQGWTSTPCDTRISHRSAVTQWLRWMRWWFHGNHHLRPITRHPAELGVWSSLLVSSPQLCVCLVSLLLSWPLNRSRGTVQIELLTLFFLIKSGIVTFLQFIEHLILIVYCSTTPNKHS